MTTSKKTTFYQKVAALQQSIVAPKSRENTFGKYSYRNVEDLMQAAKPHLDGLVLFVTDDLELIGDRYYIKATATLTDGETSLSNQAYAREALSKKGMDDSQVTGSCSSYARKYALGGLLLADQGEDADSQDNSHLGQQQAHHTPPQGQPAKNWYNTFEQDKAAMQADVAMGKPPAAIIEELINNGLSLNTKTKEAILALGQEINQQP